MSNNPQSLAKASLTEEQLSIINATGNIKINAVAGSGKTTTIIEYAAARPSNAKILYLAFNKSVKLEAARKFALRELHNVKIETAHSLAYKHIVAGSGYSVKQQAYKTHEIAEMLGLKGNGEKHAEYIIANHINKFISYFCNSDKAKVQDLNYLDTIYDAKARSFVRSFYQYIENGTRLLLSKMDKAEIEITHDFYLKKFQLSNPRLHYDYILFDEGQDASAAMLDVFLKQDAVKVIVGDTHQQIYSWRHAVNSLAKTDFATLNLSVSFRFPQVIANLALGVLDWKSHLSEHKPVSIFGKGAATKEISKATIGRTNLGLLLNAITFITSNRNVKHIYFEGNINSYTYADDGASLYDVLNLYNKNRKGIRDKLLAAMKDMDELEDYIEKTEDMQLGMMVEIVKEYGNDIHGIIKSLKALHTGDEDRTKAEMIFSTVHRAKGMEYDVVHLVNDFVKEEKLEKVKAEHKESEGPLNLVKWNEEINLLYVAVTRTKNKLHIPDVLMPKDFAASPHIILAVAKKENEINVKGFEGTAYLRPIKGGRFLRDEGESERYTRGTAKKELQKSSDQRWTPEMDKQLRKMFYSGALPKKMAEHFGRSVGAIALRIKKLDLSNE